MHAVEVTAQQQQQKLRLACPLYGLGCCQHACLYTNGKAAVHSLMPQGSILSYEVTHPVCPLYLAYTAAGHLRKLAPCTDHPFHLTSLERLCPLLLSVYHMVWCLQGCASVWLDFCCWLLALTDCRQLQHVSNSQKRTVESW